MILPEAKKIGSWSAMFKLLLATCNSTSQESGFKQIYRAKEGNTLHLIWLV